MSCAFDIYFFCKPNFEYQCWIIVQFYFRGSSSHHTHIKPINLSITKGCGRRRGSVEGTRWNRRHGWSGGRWGEGGKGWVNKVEGMTRGRQMPLVSFFFSVESMVGMVTEFWTRDKGILEDRNLKKDVLPLYMKYGWLGPDSLFLYGVGKIKTKWLRKIFSGKFSDEIAFCYTHIKLPCPLLGVKPLFPLNVAILQKQKHVIWVMDDLYMVEEHFEQVCEMSCFFTRSCIWL